MIRIERVYELPDGQPEGRSFLVERLWPRGKKKEDVPMDAWLKDVAPSTELRTWFGHDPAKWPEFRRRYRAELDSNPEALKPLFEAAREGDVTLLYSAKDTEHNAALVLQGYLEERLKR